MNIYPTQRGQFATTEPRLNLQLVKKNLRRVQMAAPPPPNAETGIHSCAVFGGSEFMGRAVVESLLAQLSTNAKKKATSVPSGDASSGTLWDGISHLTLFNRGNKYWEEHEDDQNTTTSTNITAGNTAPSAPPSLSDSLPRWLRERAAALNVRLNVSHVVADRDNPSQFAHAVVSNGPFDVVVDFCGFDSSDARTAIGAMETQAMVHGGRPCRHYVFISSDSVYEVSAGAAVRLQQSSDLSTSTPSSVSWNWPNGDGEDGRIEETAGVRPEAAEVRQTLKSLDGYGHGKLRCEELLREACWRFGLCFTALRLPDVIGPNDNTHRFWRYQAWCIAGDAQPVMFSSRAATSPLSFVYSGDVARVVEAILSLPDAVRQEKFCGEAVNVCCSETPSIVEFVGSIAVELHVPYYYQIRPDDHQLSSAESGDSTSTSSSSSDSDPSYLPSVECGPVSDAKLRRLLPSWSPTPMAEVVSETVKFCRRAFIEYPGLVSEVTDDLTPAAIARVVSFHRGTAST
jgi:nucleoside-diphosphate-sugar epimerase